MKGRLVLLATVLLMFCLTTCAQSPKEPEPDYLELMARAAQRGDAEAGAQAEWMYRLKSEENPEEEHAISFDSLYLLARVICAQYGDYHYTDELRQAYGELLLNRMCSPEYPNTLEGVIFQARRAGEIDSERLAQCLTPDRASVTAALRVLQGERRMESDVVITSDTPTQQVYAVFCDDLMGNTYFCRSDKPELYVEEGE